jgi:hypothetical protein
VRQVPTIASILVLNALRSAAARGFTAARRKPLQDSWDAAVSWFEATAVPSLKKIGCQALQQPIFGDIFNSWRSMECSELKTS